LDGLKTFEEDMSDIAGLKASYVAFETYAKNKVDNSIKLLPSLSMYSYEQLFFLAHAQVFVILQSDLISKYLYILILISEMVQIYNCRTSSD
jgi:hypothetical protein